MAATQLQHAKSSHIVSASYDEDAQELTIVFAKGAYVYEGVSADTATAFERASSAGQYLEQSIKGAFKFRKA